MNSEAPRLEALELHRLEVGDARVTAWASLRQDDAVFAQHFPGFPTAPAYLILGWIDRLLPYVGVPENSELCFENVKFLTRLRGGESISVRLERASSGGERVLFSVTLEDNRPAVSGRVVIPVTSV